MEGSRAPPRKILDLHDWAFRPEGPNRRANIDPFPLCLCADIPLNGFCHQIQALNHQLHGYKLSCLQSFYMASRWALYHHARVSKIDLNWPNTNFASTISRWLSLKLLKLLIQLQLAEYRVIKRECRKYFFKNPIFSINGQKPNDFEGAYIGRFWYFDVSKVSSVRNFAFWSFSN